MGKTINSRGRTFMAEDDLPQTIYHRCLEGALAYDFELPYAVGNC